MGETKTKQLLAYIVQKHEKASVTVLMKIAYLIDLVSCKRRKKQISDFSYRRYTYGPFDKTIYPLLSELESERIIIGSPNYTFSSEEYLVYSFNNEKEDFDFSLLSKEDTEIIDEVLEQLKGYEAKTLTEITYKTPPMKKLGATLGGNEHLNEKLDLHCE